MTTPEQRIESALEIANRFGGTNESHHQAWVIDQMVRALTGCPIETHGARDLNERPYIFLAQGESEQYRAWVTERKAGDDGPETYTWDVGIAP